MQKKRAVVGVVPCMSRKNGRTTITTKYKFFCCFLLLLLLMWCLSSCTSINVAKGSEIYVESQKPTVTVGDWNFDDFNQRPILEFGDIVPDRYVAKQIADAIVTNTMQYDLGDYPDVEVSYDEDYNLWLVSYGRIGVYDGGFCVAISKATGEVEGIYG